MDPGTAQQQVQALRAELYATRKQQRKAAQQRDELAAQVRALQEQLQSARREALQAGELEHAVHQAAAARKAAESEANRLKDALAAAAAESERQRAALRRAQEAADRAEGDRARLQRARDELARNVLGLERRAQEAEEEAARVAQEAQEELRALQARLAELEAGGPDTQAAEVGDASDLRREAEAERQRAAVLTAALTSAKRERDSARQQLARLQEGQPIEASQQPQQADRRGGKEVDSAASTSTEVQPAADATELQALRAQVPRLAAAQSKLLAELDAQGEETERLAAENLALAQAVAGARKLCGAWEHQASDSLVQIDRLKDLLEESALWQAPAGTGEGDLQGDAPAAGASAGQGTTSVDVSATVKQLEGQVVEARAQAAALDLRLRALAAETARAGGAAADAREAALPALAGLERGLAQLLRLTVSG